MLTDDDLPRNAIQYASATVSHDFECTMEPERSDFAYKDNKDVPPFDLLNSTRVNERTLNRALRWLDSSVGCGHISTDSAAHG